MFSRSSGTRRRYRSSRSVQQQLPLSSHVVTRWTRAKIALFLLGVTILASATVVPMLLLTSYDPNPASGNSYNAPLHHLLDKSREIRQSWKAGNLLHHLWSRADEELHHLPKVFPHAEPTKAMHGEDLIVHPQHADFSLDPGLARGVSGLPMDQTPALVGARRGASIQCDENVDDMIYWNRPGPFDTGLVSPFAPTDPHKKHYLTFESDPGGWNNIRMSLETILVLAAATGRTLVLPPKIPMYLLGNGAKSARSYGDFFSLEDIPIRIITMAEFLQEEGTSLLGLSEDEIERLMPLAELCTHVPHADNNCESLFPVLRQHGHQPPMQSNHHCMIFDQATFQGTGGNEDDDLVKRVDRFCGQDRRAVYYDASLHDPPLIHWQAAKLEYRLLSHFYTFLYFSDSKLDNHFKRMVRDYLHYKDELYCAAGKIVHALNRQGPWSSMHIRRGDFQYKQVKISAKEWYENTQEIWKPGEILYLATDERNKTWFHPLKQHQEVRFLDDFWDMAGLDKLDSNYMGMIDTIIASHGRAFAGTWFSTFTGYINRMRGYLGKSMKDSWYSWPDRKYIMHNWTYPHGNYPAREWPIGWVGIDGDKVVEHEGPMPIHKPPPDPEPIKHDKIDIDITDLVEDTDFTEKPVARGLAGRPRESPALTGAKRGHIECDINVDSLAYWNDPQGARDQLFHSPFAEGGIDKYITFSPDRGGWNNVRMSMEIIFVIAAVTGRTLVLPPKEPLYLLHHDKGSKHRGFADFFPVHTAEFQKRVKVISMEEFIRREGGPDGRVPIPESQRKNVTAAADHCDKRKKSDTFCDPLFDFLRDTGYNPGIRAADGVIVFDRDVFAGREISKQNLESVEKFAGTREVLYWNETTQDPVLVHFPAGDKKYRLLTHFYNFIHFTDPMVDNYFKRFVRDFLHYHDSIYCAAGKIVKAIQAEGTQRGFPVNDEGEGGYSAMHIRRGDFQYKKVKLPAEEWYENTKEIWNPGEILYIATDERNKTFFDPIAEHHDLRYLDDYWELAGLANLDPNYMGMIDTIVASRARAFAGTWFSTFTGYINRMRGYHGMTMLDSWYSFLERKAALHVWRDNEGTAYAYEWPTCWMGIDADVRPNKAKF